MREPPADLVTLCREEHPRLVRALRLQTGDASRAEDLAQEALVRLWQRWRTVRRLDHPAAWLHRVAINLAIDDHRRRAAERRAIVRLPAPVAMTPADDAPDDVRAALLRLPERQRAAVVLRYLLDLSVADVAAALDLSENATRQLTHRAVEALRADSDVVAVPAPDLEASPYAH
ncbi:MAG TPA: sigma-70 family RNA polymerase sigma factor [Acidimicrobiales bacterium]|nr:sigma-70 family RNA polymerase sigma factor [Acidimicrobiales bacterium]